jgi:cytochrome c-type biogenesis protein CcmH
MNRRTALLTFAALTPVIAASLTTSRAALGQAEAMDRSGVLDIHNEQERAIFSHLRCTCGCPREAISTCTCGSAGEFRKQVRGMIAQGMTLEQIKAEWVKRHNGPDALMVPPNTGAAQFVYLAPLGAIVGMAAIVITALRKFRKKSDQVDATNKKTTESESAAAKAGPDAYDDKLDEELKRLDQE